MKNRNSVSVGRESRNYSKTQERYTNEQVVFCQNCGTENIQVNRACHKCGTDLLTSHNKNAENPIMNSNLFTYLKYCINNGKEESYFSLYLMHC